MTWSVGSLPPTAPGMTWANAVFTQLNAWRVANTLPPAIWHDGLAMVAQVHANDMLTNCYTAGVSPGGINMAERLVSSTPAVSWTTLRSTWFWGTVSPNQDYASNSNTAATWLLTHGSNSTYLNNPSLYFGAFCNGQFGAMIFGSNVLP